LSKRVFHLGKMFSQIVKALPDLLQGQPLISQKLRHPELDKVGEGIEPDGPITGGFADRGFNECCPVPIVDHPRWNPDDF
jgi:hypothetical protein